MENTVRTKNTKMENFHKKYGMEESGNKHGWFGDTSHRDRVASGNVSIGLVYNPIELPRINDENHRSVV